MRIHHIAIAVKNLDNALTLYEGALGIGVSERREVAAEGVEIAFLPLGETEIELLRPLDPENSIGRFISKRGEGVHHICLLVDDVEAAIEQLNAHGKQMATDVRSHPDGTRYAFIHPKSANGVLVELYEKTPG
ncbi:MAG: methylmalonyl-CoA epimerase [Anaerolineae bacterium]|nr:methylmalonyl-CoA epimerase [Anaerolineae bacterium]